MSRIDHISWTKGFLIATSICCLDHFFVVADRLQLHRALLLAPYLSFLFCYELCVRTSFWRLLELKHVCGSMSPLVAGILKACMILMWLPYLLANGAF